MTTQACLRLPRVVPGLAMALLLACSMTETSPTPTAPAASSAPSETPAPTPLATPTPTPTSTPTPRYTNEPDAELAALIPTEVGGASLVVPPVGEYGLTPGDVGVAYGDLGDRFSSLIVAYSVQPRVSLYAMRVEGEPVRTADLAPHLATAGRYVGIAGLDAASWREATVGDHVVWVRPEDNATVAGTSIYTWSSGEFVFLLIGVADAVNQAIVAALPGEAAAAPPANSTPVPQDTPGGSPSPGASP